MTTNKQRHNLSVNREILSLSLPSIVTNITTPLLGLVDVAIVGHMGSAAYIGAIAIGGSMFNMLYWMFGFLRMGSSGMTAQAFGAKDHLAQSRILQQALLVAMLAGIAMIVLRHQVCEAVLWFMDVEADTAVLARTYFEILVWGAPAVLGTYVMSGWFLGMQNSRAPMWVSIFINLCNIAVSLVLVYCFNYDIPGVAVGSLVAQWGGFMLACSICLIRYDIVLSTFKEIVEIKGLKHFFRINVDIFLRTLCLVAVTLWFTRTGSRQGTEMLAVNALLMQFFTLFSFFMDGFAFAGEAICGKYIGAGERTLLRRSIDALCRWGAGLAVAFTVIYAVGGDLLLNFLSSEKNVIVHAHEYIYWIITIPVAGFLAFTWDGVFIGATATRSMLLSMAAATAVFFITYALAFPSLGNHGLWLAFICYLLTRGTILSVIGRRYRRH